MASRLPAASPQSTTGPELSVAVEDVQGSGPGVAKLRHRAEIPMLVLGLVLTAAMVAVILYLTLTDTPLPDWAAAALLGLLAPVIAWAVLGRWQYWSKIANGVEVTPRQLPRLWDEYERLARDMGFGAPGKGVPRRMRQIPPLYLLNGNGTLNAYSAKCRTQAAYVVVYSDLVDMAYRHDDFSGLRFVLAHELGHIKCGHVSFWRLIVNPVLTLTRLSPSLSRAQEYTADRAACYYAMEGAPSMMILYAGKNMYPEIDTDAYYEAVEEHSDGFWLKAVNFMADHAVGFRRMAALRQAQEHGWDVHGKML
ncbi:M48 family metallopeptidase [Corynebacterium sp. UBA2622]|uniref:M48 family metallopeptidase n=1 Tax=Corynebacterium sp. UBA2622 TaxID=1946393 RepID=UPI0025B838D4|nr:M48 family metallopeptidase [Corynebacterium sp. UBA2622]